MADSSSGSGGIGFFGVLGIVFVVLKLTGTVAWSWWWVLLPFYGPLAVALVLIAIGLIVSVVFS